MTPPRSPLADAPVLCWLPSQIEAGSRHSVLQGKRVAMVSFSSYPDDPRPRRAAEALLKEGMSVDFICLGENGAPRHECSSGFDVLRLPVKHRRGGKVAYAYQYSAFLLATAGILAVRALKRRYHLVYIHNMPDVLVFSSLVPKVLGAKVILDQHDPMPELMTTIFNLDEHSFTVQLMRWLEKCSIGWADSVITVNSACKRIFAARSCRAEKIRIVMNAPDDGIFRLQAPHERRSDRFVIMYHGSIVERNGLDLAIEALARVRAAVPGVELRIYGRKTPFLSKVMDDVRNKGLQDCVRFQGPKRLEDLVHEIEDCDVGVIPNQRNAFTGINTPTRIFEYLALGKPVIAPRTVGIQDYFGPDALFFFEPGNADELASQVHRVFSNPGVAVETSRLGQEAYLSHTWPRERDALLATVETLLADGSPKSPV